ncbi:ImmA/IrrE family metallo-endopeptidase [Rhodococcus sp. ANT_H53B]|uniref:ImmA/IrrE family metallo-endopeptidase n=1 Tax=Rhodococcus sp. ANT_H53B TaxID=2597357 RepID=UPI0011ECC161|nr:ImmA/IrrE family metallo-endopeptidase [Rhodococcus sp. ANT_H53B]
MAHPQHGYDTPELRLRRLTECPPPHGTYPERTRSNLAHEVAHFAAEHELSDAWLDESGQCGASTKDNEKEANELGGALLVPAAAAKAHAISGGSSDELAEKYCVSVPMAEWRMRVSGGLIIAQRARAKRSRQ